MRREAALYELCLRRVRDTKGGWQYLARDRRGFITLRLRLTQFAFLRNALMLFI